MREPACSLIPLSPLLIPRDGMAALLKSGALLSARSLDKIADALAHEWTLLLKEDAEAAAAAEAAPIAGALVPSGAAAAAPNDSARMKNHSGSRTASLQGADVEDGFGATGDAAAGMAGWRARAIASRMHERAAALLGSRAAELGLTLPPSCRTATMASETVSAFFEGGLERAAKLILRRASGSFGLTFSHSLDAGGAVPASGTGCSTTGGEVVVCAKGQPMSIAFYPSLGIVLFGSEAAATKAAMRLDPDNNPWWSPERNAAHRAAAHAQQTRLPSSASQPFARDSSVGHPGDGAPFRYDLDDHGGEVVLLRWREHPVQRSVMDPAAAPPQRDDPLQRVPLLSPPPLALLPTRRTELQKYEDGEELAFAYFSEGRSGELTFSSTALSTHAAAAAKPSGPTHVPVGLVKSGGASRASAAAATLRRRSIPLLDNPMVLPLPPTVDDPVGLDLQQLPPTLASLRESFGELGAGAREVGGLPRPALTNQRVARELAAALLDRLAHRGDAAAAGGAVDLDGAKKDSVDLLVAGCEVSLWVGEQFVSDLRTALPALRARAVSSNKLLALFGQNVPIPQLGHPIDEGLQIDGAVVLLLSHSGGTFATLACAKMLRAHTKHVFAVASEVDTHLGRVVNDTAAAEAAVGAAPAAKPAAMVPASMISAPAAPGLGPNQAADAGKTDGPAPPRRSATRVRDASASDDSGAGGTGPRAPSVSRCFSTLTGFRVAEPCSISVAATHQLLTHVLLSLMRSLGGSRPDLFPRARPVAAELATLCGASHLEALREIVGDGEQADTPTGARLRREGRRWADHVLEGPLSWILSAIYILVTVVVGFTPLSAALAAARPLFPSAAGAAGTAEPASFVALGYVVGVLDTAIYAFLPWWTTVLLRLAQRRPWLHRVSGRSVLIADIPWVGQCAEAYLSKLFALSYSVAGLTVYSANPHDHLVHRHTHRVVRGALLAVGRPDGRVHALAAAEATSLLSIKQASSIQSLGVTCETLTLGHNPWPLPRAIPVVLPTIRPQFLSEKLLGLYLAERPVPDASEPGNATGSAAKKNAADRAAGRWLSRLSPADEPGAPPRPMPAKSPNALGGLYAHLASLARLPPAVLRILLAATHESGYVPAERLNEQVVGARLSPIDRGRQARFDALLPAQLLAEQRTLEVRHIQTAPRPAKLH